MRIRILSAAGAAVGAVLLSSCSSIPLSGPSATAELRPASGSNVSGRLTFTQFGNEVRIRGEIVGHTPGPKGFHIHEKGDCSARDATSAGGHFNPRKMRHGASPMAGHAGDIGNLNFDANGRAVVDVTVRGITVSRDAADGIVGRGVVVHAQADDQKSDPAGNAGGRVACGVIVG